MVVDDEDDGGGGEDVESIRFRLRFDEDDDKCLLLFVLFVARNLISPDG